VSSSLGPPPGWYPDPDRTPGRLRWFDGVQWSSTTRDAPAPPPSAGPEPDIIGRDPSPRSALKWAWIGGGTLAVVVVVILVVVLTNSGPSTGRRLLGSGAGPSRPPLAALCPPPSGNPAAPGEVDPPPPGPRVVDATSGISYADQPTPFRRWDQGTWSGGTLGVQFNVGYYFVTEHYDGGSYLASVLSGAVPATVNDGLSLDLKCTGRQVAEDVRLSFYPKPNSKTVIRDEQTVLGGRPAWVSVFRLAFHEKSLKATSELVAVVLVDVGRPSAAVLYVSIPNTVKQYEPVIENVVASVRPT
jgi:hypothetical protein